MSSLPEGLFGQSGGGFTPDARFGGGGHVLTDLIAPGSARTVHGDASGVRGAAWLWGPGEEA